MTTYQITEDQCNKNIAGLVCHACGKPLTAIETVDNSNNPTFWSGCRGCGTFYGGVEERTFRIANELAEDMGTPYISEDPRPNLRNEEAVEEWMRARRRRACRIVHYFMPVIARELKEGL